MIPGASVHLCLSAHWYRDDLYKDPTFGSRGLQSSPAGACFVIGRNQVVYQEAVDGFQALSLVLSPTGFDFVADAAGMIYAGFYSDWGTAGEFAVGVAAVGASGLLLRQAIKGEKKLVKGASGLELVDDVSEALIKPQIISKLDALGDLSHAKNFVNSLDEVGDAGILSRIDNLSQTQLEDLNTFYKNRQSPQGYTTTDYNFSATKSINGEQVSLTYKHGFPEFHNTKYCPSMNYPDGTSGKFKFQSNSLAGGQPDFDLANQSLLNKYGVNSKNGDGFYQSGNYRWDGDTQWFELKNANGDWEKYTWHHYQDGSTMIPVLSKAHNANLGGFVHSGGNSIINGGVGGIKGIFTFSAY